MLEKYRKLIAACCAMVCVSAMAIGGVPGELIETIMPWMGGFVAAFVAGNLVEHKMADSKKT